MKIVVENIFMCFVLFWKCYFPTNFSHFLSYFLSIQTNFITENFKITTKSQFTKQIIAKSQHHTPPKLQFNPRQQTPAIKSHNHQNTTTTPPQQQQKSKSHKEREIGGSKIGASKALSWRWDRVEARSSEGEIERCGVIGAVLWLMRTVRSGACDHRTGAWSSPATLKACGRRWWALSLSLSVFQKMRFEGKIKTEMILHPTHNQTKNHFRKMYFPCTTKHPHLRKSIYGKAFPKTIFTQNKRTLKMKIENPRKRPVVMSFYALEWWRKHASNIKINK